MYAAANQAMDALARRARAAGRRMLSVAWGRWPGGGLVRADEERWFDRMGLEELPAHTALGLLRLLRECECADVTVAAVDWARFVPVNSARRPRPLLDALRVDGPFAAASETFADTLRRLEPEDRTCFVERELLRELAQVLDADAAELDPERGFFQMGMDSVMAVALARRLELWLGQRIPATTVFENANIRALSAWIVSKHAPPPARPDEALTASMDPLDGLSETQLLAALASRLESETDP